MSEENLPQEIPESQEQYEDLSKTEAMAGVFTAPGDTFETIASAPRKNYWLMPILISIAVGLITAFMFMSDAELTSKAMDKQKQKIREQMDERVKSGSMTREEANLAVEQSEKFTNPNSTFFRIMGMAGAIVGPFLILFILSLIYLVILKVMKGQFDFMNLLNVVGLGMLIISIGNLLGVVVSILKGDVSSIGLGLLFSEASIGAKLYGLLSKIDIFNIWFYIVIGIGLSKIAKMDTAKTMIVAFVPFVLYLAVTYIFS